MNRRGLSSGDFSITFELYRGIRITASRGVAPHLVDEHGVGFNLGGATWAALSVQFYGVLHQRSLVVCSLV